MNFKVVLALSASLSSFHAMADCIGEICVGEKVINSYNQVATVIAVDQGKLVTRDANSQLRSYSANELSDEIISSQFSEGKIVLDEYSYIGTVDTVFRNGKILYRRNGNSSLSVSTKLVPEVTRIELLKSGSRIIDEYSYKGEVRQLFANRVIIYRRDGNSSDSRTSADKLVLRTTAHGSLKVNSLVIDEYSYKGVVTDLYEDGRTFYRRNGNSSDSMTRSDKLILKVDRLGNLVEGSEVIDEYSYKGVVTDLYQDGRTFYRRQGNSSESMVSSPRSLVMKVTEVAGLTTGTSVMDEYSYTGRVTDTYQDGRVFYRRTGNSSDSMTTAPKLVKEVSALGDIKPGIFAIDNYNYTGTVTNCYADGRLIFKRDGNSGGSVTTTVFPEVETHDEYSKDTRYASNNLKVGKPSAFFSNGKIQHEGSIVDELFESVEQFEEVNKETELVSLSGKISLAKEIYSNGVVVLNDKKSSIRRVVNYKNYEDKEILLDSLVSHMAMQLRSENEMDENLRLIFTAHEAITVKDDLITFIRTMNNNWIDSKTRKKIIEKLVNTVMPGEDNQEDPEEYSLSVTPAEIIDDVKAVLDQQQKRYIFVSPDSAQASRKAIILNFSKKLLSGRCEIVIKERGQEIKKVSKKMGKGDALECVDQLKD